MFCAQSVNPYQSFSHTPHQRTSSAAVAGSSCPQPAAVTPASRLYAYAHIKVGEPKWMSYDLLLTHYRVNTVTRLSGVFPEFIFHAVPPQEIATVPTGSSLVEAVAQLESRPTISKRTAWKVTCYPILHPHRTYVMNKEEIEAHGLRSDSKVSELPVYGSCVFNIVQQAQLYRVEVIARQMIDVLHFLGLRIGEQRVVSESDIDLLGLSPRQWRNSPYAAKSSLPHLRPYSFVLERIHPMEGLPIPMSINERVYYAVTLQLDSKLDKQRSPIPEEDTEPGKARSTSCLPPLQDNVSVSLPPQLLTIPELRRAHSMTGLDTFGNQSGV